jgi:hypothetical protein
MLPLGAFDQLEPSAKSPGPFSWLLALLPLVLDEYFHCMGYESNVRVDGDMARTKDKARVPRKKHFNNLKLT